MYGLKTPAEEVAQALLIVMRRGSLRTAEETASPVRPTRESGGAVLCKTVSVASLSPARLDL